MRRSRSDPAPRSEPATRACRSRSHTAAGPDRGAAADSNRRDRRCRDVRRSLFVSLWRSAAGDAAEDETAWRDAPRAPPEGCTDLRDRVRILRSAGDVDLGILLPTLHAIAHLRVQDDARAQIDRVALLLAPRAEPHRRLADAVRGDRADERRAGRDETLDARRAWEAPRVIDRARVAPLRSDELAELGEAAAIGERAIDPDERGLGVAGFASSHEHLRACE